MAIFTHNALVLTVIVRQSGCLSQVGVLLKRLSIGLCKQCYTYGPGTITSAKRKRGHPNRGTKCRWSRLNTGAAAACWQLLMWSIVNLTSVTSLLHWASTLFVCSTFAVMQHVALVCQQHWSLFLWHSAVSLLAGCAQWLTVCFVPVDLA